jgi:3-oxoacyl-[acyl-carrier-protein] synthase II
MNILGIGILFSQGMGMASLEKALQNGWQKPDEVSDTRHPNQKRSAYQVNFEAVPNKTLLKKIRRADKLSKMSLIAAADAIADSGITDITQKKIGIILATGFGAHVTTFEFLDGILDFGDAAVSPTSFSNSVHNAAASYVSSSLNIQGPTMTVTQFRFSFQAALQLAQAWLDQGRCEYVLVGGADQYGDIVGFVSAQKLNAAQDGKIKPFTFKPTCCVPGEGATFFLVSNQKTEKSYCALHALHTSDDPNPEKSNDITIIDTDGMLPDESVYRSFLSLDTLVTAYTPLFGSMMTNSALNIAAGALMLKQQMTYAAPIQDNPHGLRMLSETTNAALESIRCIGCNCFGERSITYLTKIDEVVKG